MVTLMEEVEALISANVRSLVDSAVQANSLAGLDHYLRQVEDYSEAVHEAETTVGGELKAVRRRKASLEQRVADLDRAINVFLCEHKEDLAFAAQSRLNSLHQLLAEYTTTLERLTDAFDRRHDARLKLQAKRTRVEREREELQVLLDLARSVGAKGQVTSLDELVSAGDADIATLAKSIQARLDTASAAGSEVQRTQMLEIKALERQLAARKAHLGLSS
jgi:phage shock protein A